MLLRDVAIAVYLWTMLNCLCTGKRQIVTFRAILFKKLELVSCFFVFFVVVSITRYIIRVKLEGCEKHRSHLFQELGSLEARPI